MSSASFTGFYTEAWDEPFFVLLLKYMAEFINPFSLIRVQRAFLKNSYDIVKR